MSKSPLPQAAPSAPLQLTLYWQIIAIGLALGLGGRVVTHVVGPDYAYQPDHLDNMAWSSYAFKYGVWNIYDQITISEAIRRAEAGAPAPSRPQVEPMFQRVIALRSGQPVPSIKFAPHACNYPPLSAYIFWFQGMLLHTLDRDAPVVDLDQGLPSLRHVRAAAGVPRTVERHVIGTQLSRFIDGLPGFLFDILLAIGVLKLVGWLWGAAGTLASAVGFAVTFAAPPIILDSAFWTQADSWITAMLLWSLLFLLRERYVLAGVVYGAALMTKPQAILLAPVLVYAFSSLALAPWGSWARAARNLAAFGGVALLVAAFIAAPFMVMDARDPLNDHGAWRWFQRSYAGTIGADAYPRTTLNAFNLWWLDYLSHGVPTSGGQQQRFLKSDEQLLGVAKDTLGKALLGISIVLTWALCARKWRWGRPSWVACAFLVFLAAFALPTRVHERYIYYCIPFAIALAMRWWIWIPPMLALLLVGTVEMFSFLWLRNMLDPGVRGGSGALAVLTLLTLVYSLAVLIPRDKDATQFGKVAKQP